MYKLIWSTFCLLLLKKNPSEFFVEQQAKSNEQGAKSKSNEQRGKSNEQRAKSKGQRAKSNEQRAKSKKFHIHMIQNMEKVSKY